MNRLAVITVVILTIMLVEIARTLCYGLNPYSLGGHLPFLLIAASPAVCYALGTLKQV